jgi:hypothetical protein
MQGIRLNFLDKLLESTAIKCFYYMKYFTKVVKRVYLGFWVNKIRKLQSYSLSAAMITLYKSVFKKKHSQDFCFMECLASSMTLGMATTRKPTFSIMTHN